VAEAVRQAITLLEDQGAQLVEVPLPHLAYAQAAGTPIMSAEAASWHTAFLRERASDYGPDVRLRLRTGQLMLATDYLQAQQMRTLIQADFAAAFGRVQAILAPTVPILPPEIGRTFEPLPGSRSGATPRGIIGRLTVPANLAGLPAASLPCGFADAAGGGSRPIGLQVIGPSFGEALVLRVARAYERATDWHRRRPALD
jgi:aspartyl-tRNA(Asn)/glutamyl-tRNA(Gln) amidotransferase subunit A